MAEDKKWNFETLKAELESNFRKVYAALTRAWTGRVSDRTTPRLMQPQS